MDKDLNICNVKQINLHFSWWTGILTFPTYRAVEGRQGQGRQASGHPGCVCKKVQEKFRFLGLREEDQACHKKGHQATMVSSALLEQIFEDNLLYSMFFSGFTGRWLFWYFSTQCAWRWSTTINQSGFQNFSVSPSSPWPPLVLRASS